MSSALIKQGYSLTLDPKEAGLIVVNTCAFLTSASEESVDRILQLAEYKEASHSAKLIATGCLSQRYGDELLQELPEIDGLLGSQDFTHISELVSELSTSGSQVSFVPNKPHYSQYSTLEKTQSTPQHFAYVKIAEGCSNMCSFCNIPKLRGLLSSRSIESIHNEVQSLVLNGVKEINLISQDTSSFGRDRGEFALANLLRSLREIEGDFWIRMFYCYPNTCSDEVFEVIASDSRFCQYVDMPFQHINDAVLRRMNRKITRAQIEEKIRSIQDILPDVALRTTFIVGFPNETEEAFQELVEFVETGLFAHVGVFTYSHEDNIRSAKFGDPIPEDTKQARKKRLMEAQQRVSLQRNQRYVGQVIPVLVEGYAEETNLLLQARTQFQGPDVDGVIYLNDGTATAGAFHLAEITEAHDYDLVGNIYS
jgi:ribosomal protein S12 methylthiotransferase